MYTLRIRCSKNARGFQSPRQYFSYKFNFTAGLPRDNMNNATAAFLLSPLIYTDVSIISDRVDTKPIKHTHRAPRN